MSKALIKQLAYNAKQRMTNSSYLEIDKNKTTRQTNVINIADHSKHNQISINKLDTSHEEIMIKRAITILENDIDVINPLAQLIDYSYFNGLSDSAKQKYILEVAKIYTETKEKYLNSKSIKFC